MLRQTYENYPYYQRQHHIRHRLAPSWYRILLNQAIECKFKSQMQCALDFVIPDADLNHPNYLNHLAFCALSNDEIDTSDFVNYIDEQYDRLMVNLYQWDLLPIEFFVKLKLFLSDTEEGKFRNICKFSNFVCDLPPNFCDELDTDYRRWLALPYNMDCLKQAFIERITMDDLRQLIVFDVRALSVHEIQQLTDYLLEEIVMPRMAKKNKHSLKELTFNRDFFGMIGEMVDINTYFQLTSVSCLWLAMFGSARILSKLKWNKNINFDCKNYDKWNTTRSTWHYFSGAHYMNCDVLRATRFRHHPSHVAKFVGFGLRMFEGKYVPFNLAKCGLWKLKWASLTSSPWECVDRSWNSLADDLRCCEITLDFFYLPGRTDFDLKLYVPAECVILYRGVINTYTIFRIISQGSYSCCVLWNSRIEESPRNTQWGNSNVPEVGDESHLIIHECIDVINLLQWIDIAWYIKCLTWIERYPRVTQFDINFMSDMMIINAPSSILQNFTIIWWDKMDTWEQIYDLPVTRDHKCNKLVSMLQQNLHKIKKYSEWTQIVCGFDMSHGHTRHQSHIVNVSQLTNKFDIKQQANILVQICKCPSKKIIGANVVRQLCRKTVQSWWHLPTDISSDSDDD